MKTLLVYAFIPAIAFFVLVALVPRETVISPAQAKTPEIAPLALNRAPISAVQTSTWDGYALLKRITSCESWGDPNKEPREFKPDGTVLRGDPNPQDIGLAQINIPTWGTTAKKLDFDLYTYQGNLDMAKWLYDRFGSGPWKYSKQCWSTKT